MRKIIIGILFLFSVSYSFSQTTMEEYNYITKGYKIQTESGLDMKKGYRFEESINSDFSINGEIRFFKFKKLIKINENRVCAIMVIYSKFGKVNMPVMYLCIPSKNSPPEIWGLISEQIRTYGIELSQAYSWSLLQYLSKETL